MPDYFLNLYIGKGVRSEEAYRLDLFKRRKEIEMAPLENKEQRPGNCVVYGLRFHILPDENDQERARELAAFAQAHGIKEVHLFVAPEEWNDGLLDQEQIERYIASMRRILPILREAGLSVSLNLWATTLHCDRGRRFKPEHPFQPMVSPSGQVAKAVASFACPHWRQYVVDLYGRFAALTFDVLWIEDDFRYHNHAPLDWGGTFDPLMLERFSLRVGHHVGREELVQAILRPGEPHPWRAEWMAVWREAQLEAAEAIRDAVVRSHPRATLGLMSSSPEAHSVEGRDWSALWERLRIEGRVVHRPNFAGYSENVGPELIASAAMLDLQRALRSPDIKVYPEIENFPFGPFVKSDTCTFAQMALAQVFGSDGLLLDLNAMTGESVHREPHVGRLLDAARPALSWLAAEFDPAMETHGVGVPWRPDAAKRLRTDRSDSMSELQISPLPPARLLGSFGVSFQMRPGKVNAVWGPLAWIFDEHEIERFLRGGLWLDGDAADILIQRGFGSLIGVHEITWLEREESNYSIERITSSDARVPVGLCLNTNAFRLAALLRPDSDAQIWTTWLNARGQELGPCLSVYTNRLGGRVAVSGYNLAREEGALVKNFHRQTIVQTLIARLSSGNSPVMVTGGPHLMPLDLIREATPPHPPYRRIVLWNLSHDPARPIVQVPGISVQKAVLIRPLSEPEEVPIRPGPEGTVEVDQPVPYYGMVVLSV